jgi:hypothetical protein
VRRSSKLCLSWDWYLIIFLQTLFVLCNYLIPNLVSIAISIFSQMS